ncbi:MAG: 1-(5-phosphoribosyl)-5-[(5-phosphoribosylamino)methylideneamino]imidazole-4-carboxamide isomerase [Clostridiaceae bacterium]|nr:1-(5-phosphoribosyl)-5-[(5-phosphoribosylamino)methylideneamino]imidazole-4-carboxamide isomerase [Clostridiaceae bacterium]
MIIYPAVDIKDGRCVRLLQGRFDSETVYGDDPVEMAEKWASIGAEWLHVVDLDGARSGISKNRSIIADIVKKVKIPVQTGGGIRTIDDIDEVIALGAARVVLGTAAVKNPRLLKEAVDNYGDKIAVGIDAKNGKVAVEGWETLSSHDAVEFAKRVEQYGVSVIIYTDISTDGMLSGPNLKAVEKVVGAVGIDIIASGGVSSIQDLINLKNTGAAGAITGKAIYTGAIDLSVALRTV